MNDVTYDRTCLGPNCGAEFTTTKKNQTYCSYDCYYAATRDRSKDYYKKVREAGGMIQKVCADCHTGFETQKVRVKYCSHACYHHACLEKTRLYMQKLRDEYKREHPKEKKVRTKECELCFNRYEYNTNAGKYCEKCAPVARKMARENGPVNPSKMLAPLLKAKCFICGGEAESSDEPCKSCL